MGFTQIYISVLIIVTLTSQSANAAFARQAPVAAMLDDILSPTNAERALKILSLAARGVNRARSANFDEIAVPRYPIPPNAKLLSELLQRSRVPVPRPAPPVEVVQRPPEIYQSFVTERVYPSVPVPQPCQTPVVRAVPEVYPAAPVPMVNPFLPAASPVSAIAPPTSSLLPPMDPTQVRSHFLRKIPIPPPSL
ncbi:unnamed protein product [Chilo suppressalis]|uniref:Uncharacterized protein n=1 Tax=Chilo suppressalis TaxID=168631 RepID=A0ABN8B4Z2_CHISP|nr:unnamed protein product [Chilo suppressalis]